MPNTPKSFTLKELAKLVDAQLVGDPDTVVSSCAPIATAQSHQLSFWDNAKSIAPLNTTQAGVVILTREMAKSYRGACLLVINPALAFAKIAKAFVLSPVEDRGIHPSACVADSAKIDESAYIGPFVVVSEECVIGKNTVIHARVTLYPQTEVGDDVVIHSGCVIGADGFGNVLDEMNHWHAMPQLGAVIIKNKVTIGANISSTNFSLCFGVQLLGPSTTFSTERSSLL